MDIGPFAANAKVPSRTHVKMPNEADASPLGGTNAKMPISSAAKMPSRRISAAERLRRLEEAIAFLRQHLDNGPQPARTLLNSANTEGIAERTLHRAKDLLNVTTEREGGYAAHGQWVWYPPTAPSDTSVSAVRQEAIVESGQH